MVTFIDATNDASFTAVALDADSTDTATPSARATAVKNAPDPVVDLSLASGSQSNDMNAPKTVVTPSLVVDVDMAEDDEVKIVDSTENSTVEVDSYGVPVKFKHQAITGVKVTAAVWTFFHELVHPISKNSTMTSYDGDESAPRSSKETPKSKARPSIKAQPSDSMFKACSKNMICTTLCKLCLEYASSIPNPHENSWRRALCRVHDNTANA